MQKADRTEGLGTEQEPAWGRCPKRAQEWGPENSKWASKVPHFQHLLG